VHRSLRAAVAQLRDLAAPRRGVPAAARPRTDRQQQLPPPPLEATSKPDLLQVIGGSLELLHL